MLSFLGYVGKVEVYSAHPRISRRFLEEVYLTLEPNGKVRRPIPGQEKKVTTRSPQLFRCNQNRPNRPLRAHAGQKAGGKRGRGAHVVVA